MSSSERALKSEPSCKLICLGDSLTGPAPGAGYLANYIKWSDLVQVGFDAAFGSGYATVLNQGRAGDRSADLRIELSKRLLKYRPHLAVIWIGANNYAGNPPKAPTSVAFEADLRYILEKAKAARIRVLLVQYPVPRAEIMEQVWLHADAGNETIAHVAADTGTPVLELGSAFSRAAATVPLASLTSPIDGVHLRPGGEVVVAKAILAKLRDLEWPVAWPQAHVRSRVRLTRGNGIMDGV